MSQGGAVVSNIAYLSSLQGKEVLSLKGQKPMYLLAIMFRLRAPSSQTAVMSPTVEEVQQHERLVPEYLGMHIRGGLSIMRKVMQEGK